MIQKEQWLQINFFDIKKQTLNIASFEDKKVNTNIVVK